MNRWKLSKITLVGLVVIAICLLGILACYRFMYPFGRRSCTLRCMHSAFLVYAADHFGHFPESDKGSYDSLQKLYPEYTPSGIELAGISGNVGAVVLALQEHRPLGSNLTSWVYVPGFNKSDDPNAAILWETRQGLDSNGKRNFTQGRAVLLISGEITNVSAIHWTNFMEHQVRLRRSVQNRP